jgi:hypothetical protein
VKKTGKFETFFGRTFIYGNHAESGPFSISWSINEVRKQCFGE